MESDRLRILILEDVPMDAELVEYELGRAQIPFTARWVDGPDEYVQALESFQPDVILSDFTLPRFDGMAALRLARERLPGVPFLIVTGSVNEETAVGCMKAGATDYLLKNNLARIGPAIRSALERATLKAERQRAAEALQRSEANLRAIFSHTQQSFVLVGRDGTIQAMNPRAESWSRAILGRSLREGDPIQDFIPQAQVAFRSALRGETGVMEQRIRTADGNECWFETSHAPVVDDAGQIIGVCLCARDVSERMAAEQALRESEARYRDLFDNASDLVCVLTPEGRFLYVNRAWQSRTGYSDGELRSRQLADVVGPACRGSLETVLHQVLEGDRMTHVDLTLVTRDGVDIPVEANLGSTRHDGTPVAVRGIFRDITERRRIEDQLRRAERMQAAGRLAGGVAHEVNNMMTGVLGYSEFLLNSLDPRDSRAEEVRQVIRAATRASDVTRQLLAFTRQQVLRMEVLDPGQVVEGVAGLLQRTLGAEHQLDLRLDPSAGAVRADRTQLDQVLVNLVLNARDAMTRPGTVRVSTEAVTLDADYTSRHPEVVIPAGPYVRLAVSDTGIGMSRDTMARVFEPFFTTKPVGQGTGLGLSTVFGIVKQCGGFIWVYSEPGQGSVFKIYLPRVAEAGPVAAPPPVVTNQGAGRETILLVEDEEMVRTLTARGLREHGYTVLEAATGTEALALLQNDGDTDLILCDVVMPGMGGREVARRVAALKPDLPVLFMSGYTGEDVVQRGLLDPEAPFLQKPFTATTVSQLVRSLLDRRAARPAGPTPVPAASPI